MAIDCSKGLKISVFLSGAAVGVAILLIYFLGAFLSSAANRPKVDGSCTLKTSHKAVDKLTLQSLNITFLQYTGLIVLLVIVGIVTSCCICCGCFLNFPKQVKIAAAIAMVPAGFLLAIYLAWMSLGMLLISQMDYALMGRVLCRNIIIYMMFLLLYLILLVIFAVTVLIWRVYSYFSEGNGEDEELLKPVNLDGVTGGMGGGLTGMGLKAMTSL